MYKYRYFLFFSVILVMSTLACSIQRIEDRNSAPLTPTIIPNPTATCTNYAPLTKFGTVNVAEGLNLREFPTEHSRVIMTLLPETEVEIISTEDNGWLCVKITVIQEDMTKIETVGYVNGNYILEK